MLALLSSLVLLCCLAGAESSVQYVWKNASGYYNYSSMLPAPSYPGWVPPPNNQGSWVPAPTNHGAWVPAPNNQGPWVPAPNNQGPWVPAPNNQGRWVPQHNNHGSVPTLNNGKHNFFWGANTTYNRLLYSTRVKKDSSFLRKVVVDVDFPAKKQMPIGTINYIEVLDQEPIGEGGVASIIRGGVGYKNVTIHLKSQRNKAIDFVLNVYGY